MDKVECPICLNPAEQMDEEGEARIWCPFCGQLYIVESAS